MFLNYGGAYTIFILLYPENHKGLLDPEVDLLARVLLPLAGPEEYDDEDNDKLPLDLQYLPMDKTREPEASIRKMLLEIIMQVKTSMMNYLFDDFLF